MIVDLDRVGWVYDDYIPCSYDKMKEDTISIDSGDFLASTTEFFDTLYRIGFDLKHNFLIRGSTQRGYITSYHFPYCLLLIRSGGF